MIRPGDLTLHKTVPGLYVVHALPTPTTAQLTAATGTAGFTTPTDQLVTDDDQTITRLIAQDHPQFAQAYRDLADQCKADTFGGAESHRVFAQWVAANKPTNVRDFIYEKANSI